MAGPELIVDNTEDICFPEPELKIENSGGPVAVRFRCEKCGEVGQAFEGPSSYFVKLREMAEEQFLAENACEIARRSAAAEQKCADDVERDPREDEEEAEEVPCWDQSFDHAPGKVLWKIVRELPPSVILHALYVSLGNEGRPFAREWSETSGPGWGMMSDDEKPRLQKMTGMLVAEMGNILAAEAHADRQTGSWATPLGKRLEIVIDYVTEGLHEALAGNRGELPVGNDTTQTLAMIAAARIDTGSPETVPMYKLLYRLRVQFSRHPIADMLSDIPEEEPLTEDQLERLALVAAMSAGWSCFVDPLQSRIAEDLRQRRGISSPTR